MRLCQLISYKSEVTYAEYIQYSTVPAATKISVTRSYIMTFSLMTFPDIWGCGLEVRDEMRRTGVICKACCMAWHSRSKHSGETIW